MLIVAQPQADCNCNESQVQQGGRSCSWDVTWPGSASKSYTPVDVLRAKSGLQSKTHSQFDVHVVRPGNAVLGRRAGGREGGREGGSREGGREEGRKEGRNEGGKAGRKAG